jgi:hypothetical protein
MTPQITANQPVDLTQVAKESVFWGSLSTAGTLLSYAFTPEAANASVLNIPAAQTDYALYVGLTMAGVAAFFSVYSQTQPIKLKA